MAKLRNNTQVLQVFARQSRLLPDIPREEEKAESSTLRIQASRTLVTPRRFQGTKSDQDETSLNESLKRQLESVKEAWSSITQTMTGIPSKSSNYDDINKVGHAIQSRD